VEKPDDGYPPAVLHCFQTKVATFIAKYRIYKQRLVFYKTFNNANTRFLSARKV
jgi:hypothetical protein